MFCEKIHVRWNSPSGYGAKCENFTHGQTKTWKDRQTDRQTKNSFELSDWIPVLANFAMTVWFN